MGERPDDTRILQLEQRVRMLEEELRMFEAALAGLLFERKLTIDQVIELEYGEVH